MTCNVVQKYIEITKNEINCYMKLIFEKKYLKRISEKYIQAYLNVRFYNFYEKNENLTFRKNFMNAIKQAEQEISIQNPNDKKLIENMGLFYCYILYFDKISYRADIEETIEKLFKLRKKILKRDNEDFKIKFYDVYKNYLKQKEDFMEQFLTDIFELRITNYEGISDVYKVILNHNIQFPMIYSNIAIQKVFDNGITKEDKLNIEYSLISTNVIKDIIRGNFKKQYIVEFTPTLFKKSKKMKTILNIIDNPAIQDKLNLKIQYKDFIENKDRVYDLMRNGYKFAVILDDTVDTSFGTLSKLNVFSYILLSKKLRNYDEILENEVILKNVIEI